MIHISLLRFFVGIIVLSLTTNFVFFHSLYLLFFEKNSPSAFALSLIMISWELTKMVCEFINGPLTDYYGRKFALIMSRVLQALNLLVWYSFDNYYGCLFGMILWGVSASFQYGKIEAYTYDYLKSKNKEDLFIRTLGVYYAIQGSARGVGSFIAAYIYARGGYDAIFLCSMIMSIFSAVICLFLLPNDYKKRFKKAPDETDNIVKFSWREKLYELVAIFKKGVEVCLQSQLIRYTILLVALIQSINITFSDFVLLIMNEIKINPKIISITFGVCNVIVTIVYVICIIFKVRFTITLLSFILTSLVMLMFASAFLYNISTVSIIWLFACLFPVMDLVAKNSLQRKIASEVRSTVMSFESFMFSTSSVILFILMGVFGGQHSYQPALKFMTGVLLLVSIRITWVIYKNKDEALASK